MTYEADRISWQSSEQFARHLHKELTACKLELARISVSETVMMPRKLTAENGAKTALMGEFSVRFPVHCPVCDGENSKHCTECVNGEVFLNVNVPWTVIKAIYAKTVEHFDAQKSNLRGIRKTTLIDK